MRVPAKQNRQCPGSRSECVDVEVEGNGVIGTQCPLATHIPGAVSIWHYDGVRDLAGGKDCSHRIAELILVVAKVQIEREFICDDRPAEARVETPLLVGRPR